MTSPSTPTSAHVRPSAKQTAKSLILGFVLLVVSGFLPSIVFALIGWSNGVSVSMLAGLAAFCASAMGKGYRTVLIIAVPYAIAAGLTVAFASHALAAALVLAVAAFLRAYVAKVGLHNALMLCVIALGFLVAAPPGADLDMPAGLFTAVISLTTMLWVGLVLWLLRKAVHSPPLTPLSLERVLFFSCALAVMVGIATWCVVHFQLGHGGGWIILTILVIFQPFMGAGIKKAFERAGGTLLGFGIALALGVVVHGSGVEVGVGAVLMIVAIVLMMQGVAYWIFVTFLTPAIVLFESGQSTVTQVAELRLEATIVGVLGTLVVMVALSPLAKRIQDSAAPAPAATASG